MRWRFFNISAFFFFYFSLIGVYVIFLPKILQNIGYTPLQIGIIFSISPLMRFITPFFFLKRFKLTKELFHIALFFMLVTVGLFYLSLEDFYLFAFSNIVYGVSTGLVLPYIEIYALKYLKKENYGKSRLFGSLGFIIVALVLPKLLKDPYIGIHFAAFTIVCSVIFGYIISTSDISFSNSDNKERKKFDFYENLPLWISIFLMQVSFGAFYSFFTVYENEHGLDLTTISYLWTFGVICEILLFYYQAFFLKYDLLKIIKITVFITAIRWLFLFSYPDNLPILYLTQSLHAFSFALYHSATISYLYIIYENKKLSSQFYYGIGFGLGGFFGSLVAGYFYGKYLFFSSTVIALLALLALNAQSDKTLFKHRYD